MEGDPLYSTLSVCLSPARAFLPDRSHGVGRFCSNQTWLPPEGKKTSCSLSPQRSSRREGGLSLVVFSFFNNNSPLSCNHIPAQ